MRRQKSRKTVSGLQKTFISGRVRPRMFRSPGCTIFYFSFWNFMFVPEPYHVNTNSSLWALCCQVVLAIDSSTEHTDHWNVWTQHYRHCHFLLFSVEWGFPFYFSLSFSKSNDEKCVQSCQLICQQNLPTCCNCSSAHSREVRNEQRCLSLSTMKIPAVVWTGLATPPLLELIKTGNKISFF